MAKVRGPLLSLDARGTVAGMLLFRGGKKGVHVYQPADPATVNQAPPTPAQVETRTAYRQALSQWRNLSAEGKAEWNAQARRSGKPLSGWNLYFQSFARLTDYLTLADGEILTLDDGQPLSR